jgi:hypothetical protein
MQTHIRIAPVLLLSVGLMVASTGGAIAGSLITSAQIKDNTVTTADVKDGTLKTADLARATRTALSGATGAAGPQGAQGVVNVFNLNGMFAPNSLQPTSSFAFNSPPVLVTTTAGQRLVVSASVPAITMLSNGYKELQFDICLRAEGGSTMTNFTAPGDISSTTVTGDEFKVISASRSYVPGAGSWFVGMCWADPLNSNVVVSTRDMLGWVMVVNS